MHGHRKLMMVCCAAVLALGLAACGGGGDSPQSTAPTPTPPEPVPVDVTMDVTLAKAAQAALVAVLPNPGDSDTLTVAAGGMATRAGVEFTCDSAYPCTFTLTNNLDTIVASVSTMMLPDAADPMATAMVPPPPPDTFAEMNDGSAAQIGGIVGRAINAAAVADDTNTANIDESRPRGAYGRASDGTGDQSVIGGLGLGDSGAADNSKVELTSWLNPNGANFAQANPTANPPTPLRGTALTAADDMIDVGASAIEGWNSQALFKDWGDTGDGGDGGYETGALIYSNIEAPTEHPFDRRLANRFVNASASYAFTVRLDGTTANVAVLNDAVAISVGETANEQTKNMMLDVGGAQLETLADTVTQNSQHRGTYFGASGIFKCAQDGGCGISRKTGGSTPFGVNLAGDDATVAWVFKPDADATMMVPDQDYMVFGAWLTTPDVASGTHRLGVFYDGMDTYVAATSAFDATNAAGLRGSATYTGAAAGVYRNGTASGMFTADAMLTAKFDADSDGVDDTGEYSISGRIDNFRGTDGVFLGADTQAMPNDPVSGGENDWVVMLGADDLDDNVATAGVVGGSITGSADGVPWASGSLWTGQLYGLGSNTDGSLAPSGVAGQFQAGNANTSVVGAFGAEKD